MSFSFVVRYDRLPDIGGTAPQAQSKCPRRTVLADSASTLRIKMLTVLLASNNWMIESSIMLRKPPFRLLKEPTQYFITTTIIINERQHHVPQRTEPFT